MLKLLKYTETLTVERRAEEELKGPKLHVERTDGDSLLPDNRFPRHLGLVLRGSYSPSKPTKLTVVGRPWFPDFRLKPPVRDLQTYTRGSSF